MALTYTLVSSSTYEGRKMTLTCTQTQNVASNTSTIKWTLTTSGGSVKNYSTGPTTVKINGTQVYYKRRTDYDEYTFPAAAGSTSGTITVTHNSDGSLTIPVSLSTAIYYGSASVKTNSGNWVLNSIPRQATLSAAPNFNDEANPVITYSNPAGNAVTTLEACISLTGSVDDIVYRAVSKTGTSYTFNLTDAERNVLRNACTTATSRTVKFYLKTIIGGITYYSILDRTLSIINGNPTLSPTATVSTSSTTYSLTGSVDKFIRYYTNVSVAANATALKGATIKSYKITCGGATLTSSSGTINAVDNGTFTFTVTDSRGLTTTKTLTKTIVNYVNLTCNMNTSMTVDGTATIAINGNAFNGSFGAVTNTLQVQYRYKTVGGSYGSWTDTTATKSGNTYNATAKITGLDYQTKYVFQTRAIDKLATKTTSEATVTCLPVYDWGENDFNFNVAVTAPSLNGVFIKDIRLEGVNAFYIKTRFSLNNNGNSRQSFLTWGTDNATPILGMIYTSDAGTSSWLGHGTVSTSVHDAENGVLKVTLPTTAWDYFVLISSNTFDVYT